MNRVPIALGWEQAFEERFRRRAGQVENNPGFVRMEVMKPAGTGKPYVVSTAWRDRAAFEAWVSSEDFKRAHADPLPKDAYAGEGTLEQYEVIISA